MRPRVNVTRAALALATVALLLGASAARAEPGTPIEPPIAYLSPAEFQQVPVSRGGVDVSYTCPSYPSGRPGDYGVRFSNGNEHGADGRLTGTSFYFLGEAAALPGPQPGTCSSHLQLPSSPVPAALFFGPIVWQVFRPCAGCARGWEVGPGSWVLVTYGIDGADLRLPRRIFAGYLTRVVFHADSDLSGTEIAIQGIGRKLGPMGWTDLARAPGQPSGENVFFLKLPAGSHELRVNIYASDKSQGLPPEEVEVRRPTARRATGAGDDGVYSAGPSSQPLRFEVSGDGRTLHDLAARAPVSCQGSASAPSAEGTATARLRSARVAPDGSVTARMLSRGPTPTYVTLLGTLRHGRFSGTVTTSFLSCSGTREFEAVLRRPL